MKKSTTFVAVILFLSAVVGALTAAWLYIRRREKELDEYEQLLFSEDPEEEDLMGEMDGLDEQDEEEAPAPAPVLEDEPEQPAE